jgi:hypothetical protein
VVLLVAAAFAVAVLRPKPAYQAEDTPEGVVQNYLLAIKKADYERAYGYLSPTIRGYPASAEAFATDVHEYRYNFNLDESSTSISVDAARIVGESADVIVHETTFRSGGLFGSSESTSSSIFSLRRENGQWKIWVSDQDYWAWCWSEYEGC